MCYYSQEPHDADWYCTNCGAANYFEIGFGLMICKTCNTQHQGSYSFESPEPTEEEIFVSENFEEFLDFDERKAFKYLKEKGLLHLFRR